MEYWKDIKGYETLYQVSNLGNVKSLGNNKTRKEKILKLDKNKDGYLRIGLRKDGNRKNHFIHRLLADAFIPNPDNKSQVNHKNGIKTDNCVSNIEWSTRCENQKHAIDTGLRNDSKPVLQFTKSNEFVAEYKSASQAERLMGICKNNISNCCNEQRKTAGGFIWKFKDK